MTVINALTVIILSIVFFVNEKITIGLLVLFFGLLVSWIGSFFIYGFGELISQTTKIAINQQKTNALLAYKNQDKSTNSVNKKTQALQKEIIEDFEKEQNYSTTNDNDENIVHENECPCCFHIIHPSDTECSYCGYKFKK